MAGGNYYKNPISFCRFIALLIAILKILSVNNLATNFPDKPFFVTTEKSQVEI